ncbi:unnamed protein product [Lampetra planeri]
MRLCVLSAKQLKGSQERGRVIYLDGSRTTRGAGLISSSASSKSNRGVAARGSGNDRSSSPRDFRIPSGQSRARAHLDTPVSADASVRTFRIEAFGKRVLAPRL